MEHFEGQPYAWITAAKQAGISFGDVNKSSIKAVFGMLKKLGVELCPMTISLQTSKGAKELVQAAQQMQSTRCQRLAGGANVAEPFLAHFRFGRDAVSKYLAKPDRPVYSIPTFVHIGETAIKMELGWHREKTWLKTEVFSDDGNSFQPLMVQLRTISSPLTMRQSFRIWKVQQGQEGD